MNTNPAKLTWLLLALWLAWPTAVLSQTQTPIWFNLRQCTGSSVDREITIIPLDEPKGFGGSWLGVGGPITLWSTNGLASTNLMVGNYKITYGGISRSQVIFWPADASITNAADTRIQRQGIVEMFTVGSGSEISAGSGGTNVFLLQPILNMGWATNAFQFGWTSPGVPAGSLNADGSISVSKVYINGNPVLSNTISGTLVTPGSIGPEALSDAALAIIGTGTLSTNVVTNKQDSVTFGTVTASNVVGGVTLGGGASTNAMEVWYDDLKLSVGTNGTLYTRELRTKGGTGTNELGPTVVSGALVTAGGGTNELGPTKVSGALVTTGGGTNELGPTTVSGALVTTGGGTNELGPTSVNGALVTSGGGTNELGPTTVSGALVTTGGGTNVLGSTVISGISNQMLFAGADGVVRGTNVAGGSASIPDDLSVRTVTTTGGGTNELGTTTVSGALVTTGGGTNVLGSTVISGISNQMLFAGADGVVRGTNVAGGSGMSAEDATNAFAPRFNIPGSSLASPLSLSGGITAGTLANTLGTFAVDASGNVTCQSNTVLGNIRATGSVKANDLIGNLIGSAAYATGIRPNCFAIANVSLATNSASTPVGVYNYQLQNYTLSGNTAFTPSAGYLNAPTKINFLNRSNVAFSIDWPTNMITSPTNGLVVNGTNWQVSIPQGKTMRVDCYRIGGEYQTNIVWEWKILDWP